MDTSSNNTDTINEEHLKELVNDTAINLLRSDESVEINHRESIHNRENDNSTEYYVCDRCGQQFIDSSMLLFHKDECLLDSAKTPTDSRDLGVSPGNVSLAPFVFELPNIDVPNELDHAVDDFTDVTNATDDDQNEGSGLGFYNCDECDRQFQFASHLHAHLRRHTDTRPYECTVCGRRFRDNCLRTHMLTHTGERPHECVECTRTFSRAADLVVHLKTHTGVKAHICELCDRAFSKKGDLQRHMRVHSGERPYVCEECGKAFKILFHLRLHASVHSASRGYSCELCPKAFGNSAQLRKHVKIHSGERPHACVVCLRRFNRAANLRAHMKVHEVRHTNLASVEAEDANLGSEGDYAVNDDLVYCKIEPSEQHDVLVALPYGVIEGFTQVNDTTS